MEFQDLSVSVPCLRTIGNILTGTDDETQACIDAGVLQTMMRVVDHVKKPVRKEVVWSISNITAGHAKQIALTLSCGLFDKLIYLMLHDDPAIKKEAIWAISNATAGCNDELMQQMVQKNIIQAIGVALKFEETRTVFVALEGLGKVLEYGKKIDPNHNPYALEVEQQGLLESLEELQFHNNEMVFKKAQDLLMEYYE
jgi:importin subunit alpha-2